MLENGRLYRLRGRVVKLRWCNGDDEPEAIDGGPRWFLEEDEQAIFTYGDDGKEYFYAVPDEANDRLFDIGSFLPKVEVIDKGRCSELEPIDDSWIDEL